MGKVVYVKKARKEHKCSLCGRTIAVGESYRKGILNFHPDIYRCIKCGLKPYEVTSSEYCKRVGRICEEWSKNFGVDRKSIEQIIGALEELFEDCQSKFENMPENLKYNSQSGEILDSRIGQLSSAMCDLDLIDCDAIWQVSEDQSMEELDRNDFDSDDDYEEELCTRKQEYYEEVVSSEIDAALEILEY